jgi:twinkle protein
MPAATQLLRMCRQAGATPRPTTAYLDAIADWLRDRMWVFNRVGSAALDDLIRIFEYAHRRYGVRQFVIDSLMMTDVPEDGHGAMTKQKQAAQKIADFVKRTNSHLHLVAHPRKQQDEARNVGKMDVAGSGKITDGADNVWSVWSARKPDDEELDDKPDALIELLKQRNGDLQHKKLWLYFAKAAQQYTPTPDRRATSIVPFTAPLHADEEDYA